MQELTKLSREAQIAINDFLEETVIHNYRCAHCIFKHGDGTCYFAYECIKNDFQYYNEGD